MCIRDRPQSILSGFNIYRDGKLIEGNYPDNDYTDENVDLTNDVTYQVTAVHEEGESIFSNAVKVSLTGIANTVARDITIRGERGEIVVEGADGLNVTICTVDGRTIHSAVATDHRRVAVAPGLYIVRAGNATAKVIVK